MLSLCNKKFHFNRFLDVVQRIFCTIKKHAHQTHKKVMYHVHKRRHYLPSYIYVVMLILIILLYNIIAFNKAEDITMPIDITGIVIENEPQLIPEEVVVEQPSVEITT